MNERYADVTFDTTYSKINVQLPRAAWYNLAAPSLL
jgi:hypothetical protein